MDALRASIATAATVAHRFCNDSNNNNAALFDSHLGKLVKLTVTLDPAARLSLKDARLCELLYYCSVLLNGISTSAVTRSRLHLFLFNLAFHNVPIRKYLADDLKICGSVFECLKLSLREQLGPQNLIDVLKLLQVLTYERTVVLGIWTNSLISFLLSEITCESEPEWLPYCMAILCNLAIRSKSVCQRIRKSSSYKAFSHKLLKLLAHDSRTVVVSSLVLVSLLEEKLRDTVFCARNVPHTFQCVFNVLILGDHLMTRHIAADLLSRLVINDAPSVSSVPVITSTGKDLTSYPYFEHTIQLLAGLFAQLDPCTEESLKVYDIFLSFCSISQLRSATAQAVLRCAVVKEGQATPLLAICNTAALSFEKAIHPEVPLKAMHLLACLFQELVENCGHIKDSLPAEHILQLIENSVKTAIETVNDFVRFQCQRITEGLRLAETISNDDDIRGDLLEVVTAPLCSHIVESQMISNPIVVYMEQLPSQRTETLPDWCSDGVAIVLELLRVLTALKDYSKLHKDLYWKLLKDDRLVPFIAYAVVFGGSELTYEALLLYTHCAQIHAFPTKWLGDLIANCPKQNMLPRLSRSPLSRSVSEYCINDDACGSFVEGMKAIDSRPAAKSETLKDVDDLLENLRQRSDLKDSRVSQLLNIYERKIQIMKIREQELEKLLAKKEDSLRQSERIRNLYSNENEVNNLRQLITDCEKKLEESNARFTSLYADKKEMQDMCDDYKKKVEEKEMELALLNDELARMTQEKNFLEEENKNEREFSTLTKSRYDELKKKFEQTSAALIEKDKECIQFIAELKSLKRNLSLKEAENNEVVENLKRTEKELEDITQSKVSEIKNLQHLLNEKAAEMEGLQKELQKVMKFKDQMIRMMNEI